MELTFPSCRGAETHLAPDSHHSADAVEPPTDRFGIQAAVLWLAVGSAMVASAIGAFGWQRTLAVWSASGVALALLFVGERIWYKYVVKSE